MRIGFTHSQPKSESATVSELLAEGVHEIRFDFSGRESTELDRDDLKYPLNPGQSTGSVGLDPKNWGKVTKNHEFSSTNIHIFLKF